MTWRTARTQRLVLSVLTVFAASCGRGDAPEPAASATSRPIATEERPPETAPAPPPEVRHEVPPRISALARDAAEIARGPALTAVDGYMRIYDQPDRRSQMIGLARAGQSVPLASPSPLTAGPHGEPLTACDGGWYAVAPRGYACAGEGSTLDPNDARALAAREVLPDVDSPVPFGVGSAIGSPAYTRIPSSAEQREKEPKLDDYLEHLPPPNAVGAIDIHPAGLGPSEALRAYLAHPPSALLGERAFPNRKVAWAKEFDAEGRTWLETPDLSLIPKDKVRPMTPSTLEGVDLVAHPELSLPLAFTLEDAKELIPRTPKLAGRSTLMESGTVYARHSYVPIEPDPESVGGRVVWKTRAGAFVSADKVTVFFARTKLPYTVRPGAKWIDVRVLRGTLVAYEGDKPVYATAVSPGRDGVTVRPRSHPTLPGLYQVQWKLFTADMSGREGPVEWAVDEVPFVAYFYQGLALHEAYWHDDFGRPRSHGCVNLSPRSAEWLFRWMDPEIPRGWYAVAAYGRGVGTTVVDVRP
ncbi:MAG: L,D-transpeptidase [Polyangiaceae bacterium]